MENKIRALKEREKELRCLYRVHEIVSKRDQSPAQTFLAILEAVPAGWQRPAKTGGKIEYLGRNYVGPGYSSSGRSLTAPIRLGGVVVGEVVVSVSVTESGGKAAFLKEEIELLESIARLLGEYLDRKHTELLGGKVQVKDVHWRWRERYAEALASSLDADRFGVSTVYLSGSTARGEAGPGSDIDLVIVCRGSESQRHELGAWLEGWSLCLAELVLQQTGYAFPDGILNVEWTNQTPDLMRRAELRALPLGNRSDLSRE